MEPSLVLSLSQVLPREKRARGVWRWRVRATGGGWQGRLERGGVRVHEDAAQRLWRNGHACVALEAARDPLAPCARLHGTVNAALWWVEEVGASLANIVELEHRAVLVEDRRERIRQGCGKWAVEARGLVAVPLPAQINHVATSRLLLQRVVEAKLREHARVAETHVSRGIRERAREAGHQGSQSHNGSHLANAPHSVRRNQGE